MEKKAQIFSDLKTVCRTATHAVNLRVPVFTFNHVHDYPRNGKNPERTDEINENVWHQQVAFHGGGSVMPLIWAPIWTLVKKTSFCEQLAERFGADFTISTLTASALEETDPMGETYYRQRVELMLNYFPNGLPSYQQEQRKKFNERILHARQVLLPGQCLCRR